MQVVNPTTPLLKHGLTYALEVHAAACSSSNAASSSSSSNAASSSSSSGGGGGRSSTATVAQSSTIQNTMRWIADKIGIAGLPKERSKEVVKLLLSDLSLLQDPAALSKLVRHFKTNRADP